MFCDMLCYDMFSVVDVFSYYVLQILVVPQGWVCYFI
jgi:hypothetical protein